MARNHFKYVVEDNKIKRVLKQMLTNLSHVRSKNHGNVACIHLVKLFMLHNICHQIYGPIKQCGFCRRKQLYKLRTVIFCVAVHHLFWCKRIKYSCWKFPEPRLQVREKRRGQGSTHELAMEIRKRKRKQVRRDNWKSMYYVSQS